jgi:Magnesium chelatase, subunit ChlI
VTAGDMLPAATPATVRYAPYPAGSAPLTASLPGALEVTAVWGVAGQVPAQGLVAERHDLVRRPDRRRAGPRPGEMSLAHHGVLFLDELP